MIKERPPSQGGPPQQNTGSTLPLGVNGAKCYSSAVTASTLAIEAPSNLQHYSPGTNGHHEPEKTKKEYKDAYYENAVRMFSGIDPRLTSFDTLVLDQMVTWVKKPDEFMICGAEKCGNWFGVSKATAQASLNRLEKCEYFRCFKKGNGRGNASKYVLGELYSKGKRKWIQEQLLANEYSSRPQNFVRTKPKGKPRGKPFIKGERVQKSATFNNCGRVQKSAHKGCKKLLSQPIDQPIDTKRKESDSALGWKPVKAECTQKLPSLPIHGLVNGLVGNCSGHTKPTFDQFKLEATRLGLSFMQAESIYDHLEAKGWIMRDGSIIKNWKAYLNGAAKNEKRGQTRT